MFQFFEASGTRPLQARLELWDSLRRSLSPFRNNLRRYSRICNQLRICACRNPSTHPIQLLFANHLSALLLLTKSTLALQSTLRFCCK